MADGVNYTLKGFDQYEILLGDELRGERATLGKSLLDVQRDLKIKASYIAAIENCDLEVFSNKGFVAGYVRSYARYLGLDADLIYIRFCNESGFSNNNTVLNLQIEKSTKAVQKNFGQESTWKPGKIGLVENKSTNAVDFVSNLAPIMLVLFVLVGSVFGAMSVLKQVQKLEVVALEELPDISSEILGGGSALKLLDGDSDIYSSEELALPVFEPRDKAISTLVPNVITALENRSQSPNINFMNSEAIASVNGRENSFSVSHYSRVQLPKPVLRTVPNVPSVKILAMTPAWIRVKNEFGDVIFEKTLKQRETYFVEKELFKGELRAGNAQNVYFVIDDEVLGPLSTKKSVVKNVSLDPSDIKSQLVLSVNATETYFSHKSNKISLDTAEVAD